MGQLLLLVWLLNLFDAVATAQWVSNGLAQELNPLMAWWLSVSIWVFLVGKITLCTVGVTGIALIAPKVAHRQRVLNGLVVGLVAVYGLIAVWHVVLACCWGLR